LKTIVILITLWWTRECDGFFRDVSIVLVINSWFSKRIGSGKYSKSHGEKNHEKSWNLETLKKYEPCKELFDRI